MSDTYRVEMPLADRPGWDDPDSNPLQDIRDVMALLKRRQPKVFICDPALRAMWKREYGRDMNDADVQRLGFDKVEFQGLIER